jgi:hypothetical protein
VGQSDNTYESVSHGGDKCGRGRKEKRHVSVSYSQGEIMTKMVTSEHEMKQDNVELSYECPWLGLTQLRNHVSVRRNKQVTQVLCIQQRQKLIAQVASTYEPTLIEGKCKAECHRSRLWGQGSKLQIHRMSQWA